MKHVTVYK